MTTISTFELPTKQFIVNKPNQSQAETFGYVSSLFDKDWAICRIQSNEQLNNIAKEHVKNVLIERDKVEKETGALRFPKVGDFALGLRLDNMQCVALICTSSSNGEFNFWVDRIVTPLNGQANFQALFKRFEVLFGIKVTMSEELSSSQALFFQRKDGVIKLNEKDYYQSATDIYTAPADFELQELLNMRGNQFVNTIGEPELNISIERIEL